MFPQIFLRLPTSGNILAEAKLASREVNKEKTCCLVRRTLLYTLALYTLIYPLVNVSHEMFPRLAMFGKDSKETLFLQQCFLVCPGPKYQTI